MFPAMYKYTSKIVTSNMDTSYFELVEQNQEVPV